MERGDTLLTPDATLVLEKKDVLTLSGKLEDLTANLGIIGPEVPDAKALDIPLDRAEILVTNKKYLNRPLKEF